MRQLADLIRFAGRLLSRLRVPQAVIRLEAEMVMQAEGKRAYEVAEEQARLCLRVSSASGFRFWSRVAAEIETQVAEAARHKRTGTRGRRELLSRALARLLIVQLLKNAQEAVGNGLTSKSAVHPLSPWPILNWIVRLSLGPFSVWAFRMQVTSGDPAARMQRGRSV
jgi:hypothetical protein